MRNGEAEAYFGFAVFFACFEPVFFAAACLAALFPADLRFEAFAAAFFTGLADFVLLGFVLVDFVFSGSEDAAGGPAAGVTGSAGFGGATFAGSLARAASAFWRASASAKRASRRARI